MLAMKMCIRDRVFYYHKFPVKAIGKGSCTYGGKTYAQELSGVEYAWDKMLPKYDTPSGEGSEDVATLLYDCGLSIGMNYDDNGSGSYNFEACNAINEHFNMYATLSLIHILLQVQQLCRRLFVSIVTHNIH